MPNDEKLEKLIRLLIRGTTEGHIRWEYGNVPRTRVNGTDEIIEDYFTTTFKEQEIAVFERRYKGFDADNEVTYWTSAECIGFVANGEITWETGRQPLLSNLFRVAKESAADVDGIIDSLLK